jgi:predicted dehydrogenase/threonine dehydrogenase-like Zn-dependent dehydrogenase
MQQVIRKGLKEIIVDEVPEPVVSPHHVLIRPVYSLISSGTESASIHRDSLFKEVAEQPSHLKKVWDVMKLAGPIRTIAEVRAKFTEYAVIGYAGAGMIVDKHSTIRDLSLGERVAYGGEGTGHAQTVMAGRNLVARIPEAVPFEHACFATLGSIAMNAVRTAGIGLGDVVAVLGLGLVGQLIAQLVRLQGGVVIGIDLKPDRTQLAEQLGADHTVTESGSLRDAVSAWTGGRGADCVIVAAASKSSGPCRQALEIVRDRGRMVIVGAVALDLPWNEMYLKEIQLFMSRAYGPGSYDPAYEKQGVDYPITYVRWTENRNMEEFLRLIAAGRVQIQPLITHTFALSEAPGAYETVLNPGSGSIAVLLRYPQSTAIPFRPSAKIPSSPAPANKSSLNVALVGAGNLARWAHLPEIKKHSNVTLRAICSANGVRAKSYSSRFGAAYCCSDYGEVLRDPAVDVVVITSRNQHHAAQAMAALRAGKHVFVEKPMAITEEECRDLMQAVSETGRMLTVGFNRRFAPYYREQKRKLARRSGPAVINCRVNSPGIAGDYWMADPKIGGAIVGEACHFVDLMYWLLDSEPVEVSAYSLPTGNAEPIGENNIAASFRFADGSVANLTYCTVGTRTSQGERVEVFAPGVGVFTEDFKRLTVAGAVRLKKSRYWPEKGYAGQMSAFLTSIQEGVPPQVTARDGARATIACLRMLESARLCQPRKIDLDAL